MLPSQAKEQTIFMNYLLIGISLFMLFPIAYRVINPSPLGMIFNSFLGAFFVLLYFINIKYNKTILIAHILLLGIYILFSLLTIELQNTNLVSLGLLLIPLLSFLTLSPKISLVYSFISLSTVSAFLYIFPFANNDTSYRLISFAIFLTITLYTLALSQKKSKNETERLILNLNDIITNKTEAIKINYEDTLNLMVTMIESRDSYTGGHSERVAHYCELIAKEMDLPENECELVSRAGRLHDIGKISTPDNILLKPDKLSDI